MLELNASDERGIDVRIATIDEIQNEEIRNGLLHTLLGKENHLVSNHLCII